MMRKRAHDARGARTKENFKLIHGEPTQRGTSDTNSPITVLDQGHH